MCIEKDMAVIDVDGLRQKRILHFLAPKIEGIAGYLKFLRLIIT